MEKSHVELYTKDDKLIVEAVSPEAKEMFKDRENRDYYWNVIDTLIDDFMERHKEHIS